MAELPPKETRGRSGHIGADFVSLRHTIKGSDAHDAGRILGNSGIDTRTGFTVIDLPSIPAAEEEKTKVSEIPAWVKYLYAQFPRSEEMTDDEYLLKIKQSAEAAMDFLREVLDIPRALVAAPTGIDRDRTDWLEHIQHAHELNDLKIIYKELQKINTQGRKRKISQDALLKHVALCAFVKTTVVMFMLNDGRIELREKAFHFLNEAIFGKLDDIEPLLISTSEDVVMSCKESSVPELDIKASYCSRLKSMYSAAMKLILNREANLNQALKDAVGIRIELAHNNIPIFVSHIIKYFTSQKEAYGIDEYDNGKIFRLEIKGDLLSQKEIDNISNQFPNLDIKFDRDNKKSAYKYKDIKLRFKIIYQSTPVNVEIQILHEGNKNESGFSNHLLYDLKKKVLIMQRLFNVVPRKWLEHAIAQVSAVTNLSITKIEESFFGGILRKVNGRLVAEEFYRENLSENTNKKK